MRYREKNNQNDFPHHSLSKSDMTIPLSLISLYHIVITKIKIHFEYLACILFHKWIKKCVLFIEMCTLCNPFLYKRLDKTCNIPSKYTKMYVKHLHICPQWLYEFHSPTINTFYVMDSIHNVPIHIFICT